MTEGGRPLQLHFEADPGSDRGGDPGGGIWAGFFKSTEMERHPLPPHFGYLPIPLHLDPPPPIKRHTHHHRAHSYLIKRC